VEARIDVEQRATRQAGEIAVEQSLLSVALAAESLGGDPEARRQERGRFDDGAEIVGVPARVAAFAQDEVARWGKIIRDARIPCSD
jgi:hypothetical protein